MRAHLRYLRYIARHKWFVFLGGFRFDVPLHQLLVHDWTKLLPREWTPYVNQFYREGAPTLRQGYYHNPDLGNVAFNAAWLRHCLDNKHHWQHYAMVGEGAFSVVVPMPERFVREMLADWYGANRAQGGDGDICAWYLTNRGKMTLHPITTSRIETLLELTP